MFPFVIAFLWLFPVQPRYCKISVEQCSHPQPLTHDRLIRGVEVQHKLVSEHSNQFISTAMTQMG